MIFKGRILGEFAAGTADIERIGLLMAGQETAGKAEEIS